MKIDFTSNQLETILPKVRDQHPIRGKQEISIDSSILKMMRELLESCELDDIKQLAFQLNIQQLLACLEILCSDQDEEIAEKAFLVLQLRPKKQTLLRGWFKLVLIYPNNLLERLLKELFIKKGFEAIEDNDKISENVPIWFMKKNMVSGIQQDYLKKTEYDSLDDYLIGNKINIDQGLFVSSWRQILTQGSQDEILREDEIKIIREFEDAKNTGYVKQFGQHYLNTFKTPRHWSDIILAYIEQKWGVPIANSENVNLEKSFWKKVSNFAKNAFKQWYLLQHIESFFEGERAEFWKQYVKARQIFDVKEILNGEGFLLDFRKFGVVEFKKVGNASYIYPRGVFQKYWTSSSIGNVRSYKEKSRTIRHVNHPYWDGRIIHGRAWKTDTKPIITSLLNL